MSSEEALIKMDGPHVSSTSIDSAGSLNAPQSFDPLVILEFSPKTNKAAMEWLTAKLAASRIERGAELKVHSNFMEHSKETLLYIGASLERLLLGAEEMKLPKEYQDGFVRELTLADIDSFKDSEDLDSFLTMSEKQKVVMKGIESLRAGDGESYIPGYPKYTLYPGKTIIKKFLSRGLITNLYPLHDEEEIKRLGSEWYAAKSSINSQPIDKIQRYFGEKVAIYFSFLGIYTISLIPPALIGIIYFIWPGYSMYREASFAVFNLIWSTVFLEGWKRYCSTLCFKWGTIDSTSKFGSIFEEPRADFHGQMGFNEVTGQPEPKYPKWKRVLKFYLGTVPIISFCLTCAFFAMLGYFQAEAWMKKHAPQDLGILTTLNNLLPTIGYAVVIAILNGIYRTIAVKLNKFENHRLQSSYENHLTVKLILFEFINCFICLFYVAFYLQDRALLKTFLGTVLVTQQIVGQVQESLIPFFFIRRRQKQVDSALKRSEESVSTSHTKDVIADSCKKQAALEGMMQKYTGSMDEYLEMYIQFGYVYLFSSAFPLAAMWALLNNFIEIRTDAFKMCRIFQRPSSESANSIGAWQPAFEIIGLISVITNCALIGMDPEIQKLLPSDITAVNMVLVFVAAEHIVLAIKASVAILIPDAPKWVILQMAKQEYVAKLALRKQTLEENMKAQLQDRMAKSSDRKKDLMDAMRRRTKSDISVIE